MQITKNYLAIPYNTNMALKSVQFYLGSKLVYDINMKVDCYTPEFYAYLDISAFKGKNIKIYCETSDNVFEIKDIEEVEKSSTDKFYIRQEDEIPVLSDYENRYRPYIHFTPVRGWLSDPNGLVYYSGVYHMFYQHNPVSREWENMSWGHAVSKDLLHWEHMPVALKPDEKGNMFTGSGIIKKDKIYLFYTAAGSTSKRSEGKDFTVCMAVSDDNGNTFRKYIRNPVIFNITKRNRDPRVTYCDDVSLYIMAVYLEESRYALFYSETLTEWQLFQKLELTGNSECPDIYSLYLDDDPTKKYWVFSGASDKYYIGRFQKNGEELSYVPVQGVKSLHYGDSSYAPQTFYGTKPNEVYRMSWLQGNIPLSPFNGQLSIPVSVKLRMIEGTMYLCIDPVETIEKYHKNTVKFTDINVNSETPFIHKFETDTGAVDMYIETVYYKENSFTVQMYGTSIVCDMKMNQLRCVDCVSPIAIKKKKVKLRMIIDKNSVEIYADEGEFFLSRSIVCDYHLNNFKITSEQDICIRTVNISSICM